MPISLKTRVPPNAQNPEQTRQAIVGIREDLLQLRTDTDTLLADVTATLTVGAPTDTPATGVIRVDATSTPKKLYVHIGGGAWLDVTVT